VPLNRAHIANMRGIFDFSVEKVEIADWLADDAVRCELASFVSADLILSQRTRWILWGG